MRINNNAQSASLQGLSAQFIRMQKQKQAALASFSAPEQAQKFTLAAQATKAVSPETKLAQSAQANTVKGAPVAPLQADTAEISPAAASAQKGAFAPPSVAAPPAQGEDAKKAELAAASSATPPAFTLKDVELLKGAFGSAAGDGRFNSAYDLDGNGVINTQDLVSLLGRIAPDEAPAPTPPPTFTQKDVELLKNAFGSAAGDDRFSSTYDLDGNGTINTLDLVKLLGRIG